MSRCLWPAERLAQALNATPRGNGWVAKCPAHADETPSLSIWTDTKGTPAWDCKAGCPWVEVSNRLAAMIPDAFANNGARERAQIVAEYDYTDVSGILLGQVVRLDPKGFRQRRPDGSGGWTWKLGGLQLPLYRLPDFSPAKAVFIVEGEKDADSLFAAGIPATTNPGGSGKWKGHHSAALAQKRVCIIADKDAMGRAHAEKVAKALDGIAATVRVIEAPDPFKDATEWLEGGGTAQAIAKAAKNAPEWRPSATPATSDAAPGATHRPTIRIVEGELPRMVSELESAFLAAPNHGGLYQRGGHIVRVIRLESAERGVIQRAAGSPVIREVPALALAELATESAQFIKYNARSDDWRARDCPRLVADTYAAREGSWKLRPLMGVLDAPTLRADGSILQAAGYDADTGLLLLHEHPVPILESPTKQDARDALAALQAPLDGFPFDGDPSFSVVIAAILTACIRHAIPSAPMFLFDAPTAGTGKSLLVDVISRIATGLPASSMSQAASSEEDAKRLLAVLMEGIPLICIDNAERPLEGDALSSILTQPYYRGRVLGANVTASVPTSATFLATGNNISVKGDLTRRVLICRLDAGIEYPEDREFGGDLKLEVLSKRLNLVGAALTILRAYIVAGSPNQGLKPYGGFEQWSAWIRNSLVWLGAADPCESRHSVRVGDEVARQLGALLSAWEEKFGKQAFTISAAFREPGEELFEAAIDITPEPKGGFNSRKLGRWIRRYDRRIVDGRCFAPGEDFGSHKTWKVLRV